MTVNNILRYSSMDGKFAQKIICTLCERGISVLIRAQFRLMVFSMVAVFSLSCAAIPNSQAEVKISESPYLKNVVYVLSESIGPRNFRNLNSLNKAKKYVFLQFQRMGYIPEIQAYRVRGREFANIVVSLGPRDSGTLVVGAHYDSFAETPGADDNASGVAGLLLLAKKLKVYENQLTQRVQLVAYTLEEPPFFRSEKMGSYVHAKQLHDSNADVLGMICLEMIGYFSEEKHSQTYPLGIMKLLYPSEGNFIGVVSNFGSGSLKSKVKRGIKQAGISVESMSAPKSMVGVDFSDHLNYWRFGYKAVMVTDTSFYRNPHYHEVTDTFDTLDYERMEKVVHGVLNAVVALAVDTK